jgi:hypothetical protein
MRILDEYEIFKHCKIGFEFEFYSSNSKEKLKVLYSNYVPNKTITIPYSVVGQTKVIVPPHSDYKPSASDFKLEVDGSGGSKMVELVTGSLDYYDARTVLAGTLNFIKENGWTDERCGLHFNVSFTDDIKILKFKLSELNIIKFILSYDEELIYGLFPNRRNNVYTKSIKNIHRINPFINLENSLEEISNYSFPKTKYYGVNFSKLEKNYLEFRYLGGSNYETRYDDIMKIIDVSFITLYNTLKNNNYLSKSELKQLVDMNQKISIISECFNDPDNFRRMFPKINITVNLSDSPSVIKTYWQSYKYVLFDILYRNNVEKSDINYDSELGKYQIANARITDAYLNGYEIINCEVSGVFSKCWIYDSIGLNIELNGCRIYGGNSFKNGKLEECIFKSNNNYFSNFWIHNRKYPVLGKFNNCILRKIGYYNTDFKTMDDITVYSPAYNDMKK